jgi:GAF domain-containing protein
MSEKDRSELPPHEAFEELTQFVLSEHSIESVMNAVATIGKRLLPGVDEASVTFVRSGKAQTVASTGQLALDMDERQYQGHRGPCLSAAQTGQLVHVHDSQHDPRYPAYAAGARQHGVISSLSVPVQLPEPVGAAINLYSQHPEAFDPEMVELAQTLAGYAGIALANMHLLEAQTTVADNLRVALESRAVIEQAKGALMAQRGCSADEAFDLLVTLSQDTNRKLRDVAATLLHGMHPDVGDDSPGTPATG